MPSGKLGEEKEDERHFEDYNKRNEKKVELLAMQEAKQVKQEIIDMNSPINSGSGRISGTGYAEKLQNTKNNRNDYNVIKFKEEKVKKEYVNKIQEGLNKIHEEESIEK
ncbi:hypothetical protein ILUMI_17530, partial [Ignelater luminosus]